MKYSVFLGCTIPARQVNYEQSARKVCEVLGIELVDADYGCCGFPVEPIDETKALAMAAVNLMLAEETGLPVFLAEDPLCSVVMGAGKALEELDILRQVTSAG